MKATITYEVTTHESAAEGANSEHGFWLPGGWEHALEDSDGHHAEVLEQSKAGLFDISLREALKAAADLGATHEIQISGTEVSARSVDPPCDRAFLEDGESRQYAIHIDCGTPLRARLVASALRSA